MEGVSFKRVVKVAMNDESAKERAEVQNRQIHTGHRSMSMFLRNMSLDVAHVSTVYCLDGERVRQADCVF